LKIKGWGTRLLALFINRLQLNRGIVGVRSIQFLAVAFVLPMTVLLSKEGKLDSEAVAFFGTVIGYVLQFTTGEDT
jgi:hypothetical protein